MTLEDHVTTLFSEANPVRDPSTLVIDAATIARLETTEQWSTDMEDTNLVSIKPPTRRRWLIAAAAAVLVLIVGLAAFAVIRATQSYPITPIPVIGISDDPAAAKAFTIVETAYAAYNDGDLPTWSLARDPGSVNFTGEPDEISMAMHAALHAAGDRYEVEQCTNEGFGDWGMLTDQGDIVTGYRFTCHATSTNSFHGAAGIVLVETFDWVLANGAVVAARSDGDYDPLFSFNRDFQRWLADHYPEVASSLEYNRYSGFPVEEDVATAIEFVDRFVEDSPDWPR